MLFHESLNYVTIGINKQFSLSSGNKTFENLKSEVFASKTTSLMLYNHTISLN